MGAPVGTVIPGTGKAAGAPIGGAADASNLISVWQNGVKRQCLKVFRFIVKKLQ